MSQIIFLWIHLKFPLVLINAHKMNDVYNNEILDNLIKKAPKNTEYNAVVICG